MLLLTDKRKKTLQNERTVKVLFCFSKIVRKKVHFEVQNGGIQD